MDQQSICELLRRVEQDVDVNSMCYEDAQLWPLIRQFLWVAGNHGKLGHACNLTEQVKNPGIEPPRKTTLLEHLCHLVKSRKKRLLLRRNVRNDQHACVLPDKPVEICFLSQQAYYSETLKGKSYNRIIDPVYEVLRSRFSCLKLEERQKRKVAPERAYCSNLFEVLPLGTEKATEVGSAISRYDKTLGTISSIAGINGSELVQSVSDQLKRAVQYRDTFLKIFERLQPKMFFHASYYFPPLMGINWAASRNTIPTIDIQHGKQGKFQGMYAYWTKIPEKGYPLLPTWFWSWGRDSAENIMKWQPDRTTHRCLVGGYPWISRWNDEEFYDENFELPTAEKTILITTQAPVGGLVDFFPQMLVDAIGQSPENWCWIIREHPNYKQGNAIIKEKLQHVDSAHYIMDAFNTIPLYTLLSACDFHVTAFSSVCYEAETFSVPTAIFSKIGRKMYSQEILDGRFAHCDSSAGLLETIATYNATQSKEPYIESDTGLIFSAVQEIEKGNCPGPRYNGQYNAFR